jgi:hypothetical protein
LHVPVGVYFPSNQQVQLLERQGSAAGGILQALTHLQPWQLRQLRHLNTLSVGIDAA